MESNPYLMSCTVQRNIYIALHLKSFMIDSQHITANISLETFIRVTKKEDFAILKSASYIIEKSNLKISNSQVEKWTVKAWFLVSAFKWVIWWFTKWLRQFFHTRNPKCKKTDSKNSEQSSLKSHPFYG